MSTVPTTQELRRKWINDPSNRPLGIREKQVIQGICCGLSNKEISVKLGMSEPVVRYHLRELLDKLDLESERQLIPVLLMAKREMVQ